MSRVVVAKALFSWTLEGAEETEGDTCEDKVEEAAGDVDCRYGLASCKSTFRTVDGGKKDLTDRRQAGRNDFARVGDGPSAGETRIVSKSWLGSGGGCRRVGNPWVDAGLVGVVSGRVEGLRLAVGRRSDGRRAVLHRCASSVDLATIRLDGLPCTTLIAVAVLCASGIILNFQRLDFHSERTFAVIGWTLSPLDGTLGVGRIAAAPSTNLDLHGSLWVLVVGIGRLQHSNRHTVDLPDNLFRGPDDGVFLDLVLVVWVRVESATVVGSRLPFAKEVGLHLSIVGAEPLPVDLVEGIRLQDETAHNSRTRRGLDFHIRLTEHNVPFRSKLRSIAGFGNGKGTAVFAIGRIALGRETVRSRGEVDIDRLAQGRIGRAVGSFRGVAVGIGLSERRGKKNCR